MWICMMCVVFFVVIRPIRSDQNHLSAASHMCEWMILFGADFLSDWVSNTGAYGSWRLNNSISVCRCLLPMVRFMQELEMDERIPGDLSLRKAAYSLLHTPVLAVFYTLVFQCISKVIQWSLKVWDSVRSSSIWNWILFLLVINIIICNSFIFLLLLLLYFVLMANIWLPYTKIDDVIFIVFIYLLCMILLNTQKILSVNF